MSMHRIDLDDWLSKIDVLPEIAMRLILWERDILSCQLSLHDYRVAQGRVLAGNTHDIAVMLHHASNFVCAMRRVGRGLEALSRDRAKFNKPVAKAISLVWRKKKAMFDSYIDPRNAIEHLDKELAGAEKWSMFNLIGDKLCVTNQLSAEISESNLNSAVAARDEIVQALIKHMPQESGVA